MKKKQILQILGTLSLCFALAGGVSVATTVASAETSTSVITIEGGALKIDGTTVVAEDINFKTWHKASIRYDSTTVTQNDTEYEYTGMRFLSWIDQSAYDALVASDYTVKFGTLIANETTVKEKTDFTKDYLANTDSKTEYLDVEATKFVAEKDEKSGEENVTEFSAVLYGTGESNYTTVRMARAYMTVTSEDGTQSVTIYATRTADEGRSIADVAYNALASSDYDEMSDDQYNALNTYAKHASSWIETETAKGKTYDYMSFVNSLAELQRFAAYENMYIKAVGDIDLSNATWTVSNGYNGIADANLTPSCVVPVLSADLDGNGKKMSGLTLTEILTNASGTKNIHNIGFFGNITGNVENLIFNGELGRYTESCDSAGCTNSKSGYAVERIVGMQAGLFAWKNAGTIKNCYIMGKIYNVLANSTVKLSTVGAVYMNSGTIENVMTDMKFIRGWSYVSSYTGAHNCEYYLDQNAGFTFAVSNTGTVKDCVTVMSQYTTKVDGDGVRIWTTSGLPAVSSTTATYTWYTSAYVYQSATNTGKTGYSGNAFYTEKAHCDMGRSNCYIFEDYGDLISDAGVGYNDDNQTTMDKFTLQSSTYTAKTGADGKSALGDAWSFADGQITLRGTVVWQEA